MPNNLQSDEPMSALQVDEDIQCKTCALSDDGTPYSNHYTKGSCQAYPYPAIKPREILWNGFHTCIYYKEKVVK